MALLGIIIFLGIWLYFISAFITEGYEARKKQKEEEGWKFKKTKRTAADWTQKERDRFVSGNITRWW